MTAKNEDSDYGSNDFDLNSVESDNNILTITNKQSFFSQDMSFSKRKQSAFPSVPQLEDPTIVKNTVNKNLSVLTSIIYAVFLVTLGGLITLADQSKTRRYKAEIFSIVVAVLGIIWLIFVHFDIHRYKEHGVLELNKSMEEGEIRRSQTANVFVDRRNKDTPPYLFLKGRHGGIFYLKIGMAVFCFGHLIYEGLHFVQQVIFLTKQDTSCVDVTGIVLHVITPVYSFYQLFICFKYANVIINRLKPFARFGLIHLFGTSLFFWLSTVVEDALQDYNLFISNSVVQSNTTSVNFITNSSSPSKECVRKYFLLSPYLVRAVRYLYPFTIEYNLLLAGVWFGMWRNIGKDHKHAMAQHLIRKKDDDVRFESNLVLNVDCHSANRGLFVGLFLLFVTIVTLIVFFVAMNSDKYVETGVELQVVQEMSLLVLGLISVSLAWRQIAKLDVNVYSVTFLDDFLMFFTLPFFFINGILTVWAELQDTNYVRVILNVLEIIQVIFQTVFISDGLRRCSNKSELQFRKPGREVITFLIILNVALWIVNTFQHKSIESFLAPERHYGIQWMFVEHATLPLMLFYRFHSSVCLVDVWQSAYKKGE
ncbi:otopetrin-1-like [Limulus polyphemus]|uniref:Otopetrin-1-like n=1 Tax=Limulus polyphemus TaxID=6850 RepID=A0ABM1RVW4_LIMPO|nr:otopetrin-1-like [Limulus polyphemus]XP_022235519.1 otopetrin-1-like [Limulus polyphemus]